MALGLFILTNKKNVKKKDNEHLWNRQTTVYYLVNIFFTLLLCC